MSFPLFTQRCLRRALLSAFGSLAAACAVAQTTLDPVVVTAKRQPSRVKETLADVTVIDREEIQAASHANLASFLSRHPGLQAYNAGGLGKQSSLIVRGANPAQTLVLVDGMRVGSVSAGTQSLEHLPLSQIERIEIVRGAASALYGSDAIGGVIQIFTRRGEGRAASEAAMEAGPYGWRSLSAGFSAGGDKLSWRIGASHETSEGFSAVRDEAKLRNAFCAIPCYDDDRDGYRRSSASGRFEYRFAKEQEAGFSALVSRGRNEFDAPRSAFDVEPGYDDHNDFEAASANVFTRNRLTSSWLSTLRGGYAKDVDKSRAGYNPQGDLFRTRQRQVSWQNDIALPLGTGLFALESLRQTVTAPPTYQGARDTRSVLLGWNASADGHRWQLNARRDLIERSGAKTSATGSYGYAFSPAWRLSGAVGTAFRAPTFNDLYYPGFSNPDLKPERAINRELRLVWTGERSEGSLTAYRNRVRDLIALDAGFIPRNIGRSRMDGVTLAVGTSWQAWKADVSLDWLDARDATTNARLARRARWSGNARIVRASGDWKTGVAWRGLGMRHDSAGERNAMGGFGLLDLFADYRINRQWTATARIDNALDKQYETVYGYGTPGLGVFLGLRYHSR